MNALFQKVQENPFVNKYLKFSSSIYGRVVFIIVVTSIILFAAFSLIFRSINTEYLEKTIEQCGTNVRLLVNSALYHSMLENDSLAMQNTMNVINQMSGIEHVSLYGADDQLAYTTINLDSTQHGNPNCTDCHTSIDEQFSTEEYAYRIVDVDNECLMVEATTNTRHLLIKSPIYNEPSCYTADCHAHDKSERVLGTLILKYPLTEMDAIQTKLSAEFYVLTIVITLLLIGTLLYFTKKRIRKPLKSLIKVSEAVARGDHSKRAEVTHNQLNDMQTLSLAFNNMLDKLEDATKELQNWSQQLEYKVQKKTEELGQAQSELINVERIASLGKLSLSVAHEINNPLSGILIYTKLVNKQLTNQEMEPKRKTNVLKHLKMIETETKRCGDIVKGLLDFSRKDQNNFEDKHLHKILKETYDLMAHSMKISKVSFHTDLSANSDFVNCSPNQIKQACIALLVNASEAVNENGDVVLRTYNPDEKHITIEISDNGVGISPDDIGKIFQPFFTTKENQRGTGLGLAIVHGIVENHNGNIKVDSQIGRGTSIKINLPLKPTKQEDKND